MTTDDLFAQLKHPNPHLQERAMAELARLQDETIIPRLMGILGEEDISYRRSAVKALGAIGFSAVPILVETLFSSDNPIIRASCTKALAQVAVNHADRPFPEVGLQGLTKALQDDDPVVHISAVMALGAIGSPVLDILVTTLRTTDNLALGVTIINALGSMGDSRAIEVLTELVNNEASDPYIRESATSALSRLELVREYRET